MRTLSCSHGTFILLTAAMFLFQSTVGHGEPPPPNTSSVTVTNESGLKELFQPGSTEGAGPQVFASDVPGAPIPKRSREVSLSTEWLPREGGVVHAVLFDDTDVNIIVDSTTALSGGLFTVGHVAEHPELQCFFGSYRNAVAGSIHSADGRIFSLMPTQSGGHVVIERIDQLSCLTGSAPAPLTEAGISQMPTQVASPMSATTSDTLPGANTVIDVLIIYSPEAKVRWAGPSGTGHISLILLEVGYMNQALLNSGCSSELRLVYYCESSAHHELGGSRDYSEWLKLNGVVQVVNGQNVTVNDLRTKYGADLVGFLNTTSGYADLQQPFFVFRDDQWSMAHEAGHCIGCQHDHGQDGLGSGVNYGFLHAFWTGFQYLRYGDVMSYSDVHLPFYSNPDFFWWGISMGDVTTQYQMADNHSWINDHAGTVAGWMSPVVAHFEDPKFTSSTSFDFDLNGATSVAGQYTIQYATEHTGTTTTWNNLSGYVNLPYSGGSPLHVSDTTVNDLTVQRYYRALKGTDVICTSVGFYRHSAPAGYSIIGNHLDSTDNRISHVISPKMEGLQVIAWDQGPQNWGTSSMYYFGQWGEPTLSFGPGEALLFYCPVATKFTFVGFVQQRFFVHLFTGWQMVASGAPQSGLVSTTLKFPFLNQSEKIARMTGNNTYTEYTSTGSGWSPQEPTIDLGEGFWSYKFGYNDPLNYNSAAANTYWERLFWNWP